MWRSQRFQMPQVAWAFISQQHGLVGNPRLLIAVHPVEVDASRGSRSLHQRGGSSPIRQVPDPRPSAVVHADAICKRWKNQSSGVCDQNRARFVEKLLTRKAPSHTATQLWNKICHEFGHAVGFGHGTSGRSCMDGGGNGTISWYEIQKVNGRY